MSAQPTSGEPTPDHRTAGRDAIRSALETDMTIDITTTGRTSGRSRRIEIWFLNVDGTVYITGTSGRRDWLANLMANPRLTFHLKESVEADLPAVATVVHTDEERRRVFTAPTARWYLQQGETLDELVANAPMVRIDFDSQD